MAAKSYVVVFPSAFSRRHIPALARNIRRVLDVQNESYTAVRRDGPVILVDAHDPVFASTAIGLLYGVDRTIIARRVDNHFDHITDTIAEVGGNLLLAGDRFVVQVEGRTRGFLPRDVEMAATSRIIENKGARPGTAANHDKILYAYLTAKHGYVAIFSDYHTGGIPLGVQGRAICCIFDVLSAIACLETIRQGFEVDIMICYAAKSQRLPLSKMLNRIIPRMIQKRIRVDAVRIAPHPHDYPNMVALTTGIIIQEARLRNIRHVTLPISRTITAGDAADRLAAHIHQNDMIPVTPLPSSDRLFDMARELNIDSSRAIHDIISKKPAPFNMQPHHDIIQRNGFTVQTGPNNMHDILDAEW